MKLLSNLNKDTHCIISHRYLTCFHPPSSKSGRKSPGGIFVRLAKATTSFFYVAVPRIFPKGDGGSYTNRDAEKERKMEREYPSLEGNRHSGDEVTGSGRILAWMSLEVIGRGEHPLCPPCPPPIFYTSRGCETPWNRGREVSSPVTTAASTLSPMDFQPIDIDTSFDTQLLRQTLFRSLIGIACSPLNFPGSGHFFWRGSTSVFFFFFFFRVILHFV